MNGRLITNNVLVTFEIMHHINQRKGGGGDWRDGFET